MALTRTLDPNRLTRQGIFSKLAITLTPDPIRLGVISGGEYLQRGVIVVHHDYDDECDDDVSIVVYSSVRASAERIC